MRSSRPCSSIPHGKGAPRKLLVQASRNGFFYVLDRTDGKFLLRDAVRQSPDVGARHRRRWTAGAGAGTGAVARRHARVSLGTRRGELVFHVVQSAHRPLLRADARELQCVREERQRMGCRQIVLGRIDAARSQARPIRKSCARSTSRPGKVAWELPQAGPGAARGGTLATASGLLFFCDDQDRFAAVDAASGKILWQFGMNSVWRASPIAYQFDGRQHIAIASGSNIVVFGLVN